MIRGLQHWVTRIEQSRDPDRVIGDDYLLRWYIWRTRWSSFYIHRYLGDDDPRALHDHPWPSVSLCLEGELLEHLAGGRARLIRPGQLVYRGPRFAHRLSITVGRPLTLFLTGPRVREWGFHCPQGWRHWTDFVDDGDRGQVGIGCGEPE